MRPSAALAFILSGVSLRLLSVCEPAKKDSKRFIAQVFAAMAATVGILTLLGYIYGLEIGKVQILSKNVWPLKESYPSLMSPLTAINFVIVGAALMFIDTKALRFYPGQILALIAAFIAATSLLGRVYGIDALYKTSSYTWTTFPTSLSLLMLCLGILFLRPDRGIMLLISRNTVGGFVARRLLPVAIIIPPLLGWIRLLAEEAGFYGTEFGLLLFATSNVLIFVSVIWFYGSYLDETDSDRIHAEEEVRLLQAITQSVSESKDFDSAMEAAIRKVCRAAGWSMGEVWVPSKDGACLESSPAYYLSDEKLESFRKISATFRFEPGIGLPGRAWSEKKAIWMKDVTQEASFPRASPAREAGIKAGVSIPILAEDEVVAVMNFFILEPKEEDKNFIKLISTIAAQLGMVFQRKRAADEIHKLNIELEQRVEERTSELTAANRELESFSYSVSHDLRAPLRHVMGYVNFLMKNSASVLDEAGLKYLNVISDAAKRMGNLIDDLLAFSRMGRTEIHKNNVNLDKLAREVIEGLHMDTGGRIIEWQIGTLPEVYGDRAMLKLALENLISNAIKFTSTRARAEIKIGFTSGEKNDTIFIRDNGVGFDMKYVNKLFGVFQRLHRREEFEGTGIGLANVHRIISRHGGRTWAEGSINEGAIFYFSLPKYRGL